MAMKQIVLDNYQRQLFDACERKYYWRIVRKKVPLEVTSMAPYYGIAIHRGMELRNQQIISGKSPNVMECLKAAADEYIKWYVEGKDDERTIENLALVFVEYWKRYKEDYLQPTATEVGGLIEISPELLYGGRIDALMKNPTDNEELIHDYKSTSRATSKFNVFNPNNQFLGYILIVKELMGKHLRLCVDYVGTTVKKTKEVNGKRVKLTDEDERVDLVREFVSASQQDFNEFKKGIIDTAERIRKCEEEGFWPKRTHSCPSFQGCEYLPLCQNGRSKEMQEGMAATFYREEEWKIFEEE